MSELYQVPWGGNLREIVGNQRENFWDRNVYLVDISWIVRISLECMTTALRLSEGFLFSEHTREVTWNQLQIYDKAGFLCEIWFRTHE